MLLSYNTSLSPAPIERLFSSAGLSKKTPRRNKLTDKMFEMLSMLKVNVLDH